MRRGHGAPGAPPGGAAGAGGAPGPRPPTARPRRRLRVCAAPACCRPRSGPRGTGRARSLPREAGGERRGRGAEQRASESRALLPGTLLSCPPPGSSLK